MIVQVPVLDLVRVGLEDLAEVFEIKENLFDKYITNEVFKNKQLVHVLRNRDPNKDWKTTTPLGGPGTALNAMVIYVLIRHYGLEFVFETGVSGGFYSAFILDAIYGPDGTGRTEHQPFVRSVELSDDLNEVGKLVPVKTRTDWDLITGVDSLQYLKTHGDINRHMQLYCHDSLHTMSHMLKEITEFKKCELDQFFIFIDDEKSDNFWNKCLQTKAFNKPGYDVKYISGQESRLKEHLGGFIKYERIK